MNSCIFTCCTQNYLDMAISLYKSIIINSSIDDIIFYIYLINIDKNNYFEKNKNDKLIIEYENIDLEKNKLRTYASCVRANIFSYLVNKYEKIFWMDADTIIRKNINYLFKTLNTYDVIIYKSNLKDKNTFDRIGLYKTGIIGIKKNNKTIQFLNDWNNMIFSKGKNNCVWYEDQRTISKLLINSDLKIYNLDQKYIDWDFNKESYIWVGKGKRKYTKYYLNEQNKYY